MSNTVDQTEIQAFSKDASSWWDEAGPFAPLHKLNPVRMGYIRMQICAHFGLSQTSLKPFTGLKILDIGCGGGLVCEPLARLGGSVTGADADPVAIGVARDHASVMGLDITYKNEGAENIRDSFDAVLALEIIEHVSNPEDFVKHCARLLKPGGIVIFSTLNRTAKSYALGIVAAEYILGWVPKGTHTWQKFFKPSELSRMARAAGLESLDISGLVYKPLHKTFGISKTDTSVNYFLSTSKGRTQTT
jgi:2-polyprenyl-6-hydroxyphenyl methylase/3-demethylubiquinone-9 3-methyltransferase